MRRIALDDLIGYNEYVCKSNGEECIIINENNLLSALSVQDSYFETEEEIISALFRSIIIGHGFQDGNKRTAVIYLFDAVSNPSSIIISDSEIEEVTLQIAIGRLTNPYEIANILFGE